MLDFEIHCEMKCDFLLEDAFAHDQVDLLCMGRQLYLSTDQLELGTSESKMYSINKLPYIYAVLLIGIQVDTIKRSAYLIAFIQ